MTNLIKSEKLVYIFIKSLIIIGYSSAIAGPPLVTDDAGVLDPGGWEVIVSVAGESRPAADSVELPAVEVSYGFYENMQLTGVIPR